MSTKQEHTPGLSDTPLTDAFIREFIDRPAQTARYPKHHEMAEFTRRMERDRAELLAALERLNIATCLILQSKPVRDMDEALFEARAAIAKAKA